MNAVKIRSSDPLVTQGTLTQRSPSMLTPSDCWPIGVLGAATLLT